MTTATGSADERGLVVVGGGPAGVSAAIAFHDAGGRGRARIVTADLAAPYERPPLSKEFLRGELDAGDVELHDPAFYADRGIELILGAPVLELSPGARTVLLADGRRLDYDACVLATGAEPVRPQLSGADAGRAHVLRSLRDAAALRAGAEHAGTAVVAGSGFIGCEAAASLAARGVRVTLVTTETLPQVGRLGEWAAERIAGWLRGMGVELVARDKVVHVSESSVRTEGGRTVAADLVLLATGVRPCGELAAAAGLDVEGGRIRVDAAMRASVPGVFAAGDVALADNAAAGRPILVEHWGDALAMGEIAGRNAAGGAETWSQPPGFWSTIGDHTLKYCAWGDGFHDVHVQERSGAFAVWYTRRGRVVGLLAHDADDDYDRAQRMVAEGLKLTS